MRLLSFFGQRGTLKSEIRNGRHRYAGQVSTRPDRHRQRTRMGHEHKAETEPGRASTGDDSDSSATAFNSLRPRIVAGFAGPRRARSETENRENRKKEKEIIRWLQVAPSPARPGR